jgi:outer membrane protein
MLMCSITPAATRGQESPRHPVTLEEAIAVALRNAPRLRAAESQTEAARQRVNVSKSGLAMQTFGVGGYEIATRHDVPQGFTARVGARKILYDGGLTRATVEQSKANVASSQAQLANAQQDVVLEVKRAFYDVLYAQEWEKLKQQTVTRARGYVELAKGLFDKGQVPERDITQAATALANAQFEAADAESKVNAAKAALRSAMGLAWDAPLDIAGAFAPAEALPDLKTFIEQTMRYHPDLQKAQADLLAAQAAVGIAASQRKPMIAANSAVGVQENALPPARGIFLFSATVRVPFRDGGQAKAEIAQAQAALASAEATLKQIKLETERKVAQAWYLVQSAQQRIDAAEKAVEPAQDNLRLAEAQYRLGVGTLLGVTDAQVALLTALTNRTNAIYAYRLSEAALQRAAGLLEKELPWCAVQVDAQIGVG